MMATSSQLVELAADLALDADQLEAARPVQGDRGLACRRDPGEHGVEPETRGDPQQLVDDQLADALAVAVAAHVDRVLDAGAIGGPLLVRRQRAEADDVAAFVGPDRWQRLPRTRRCDRRSTAAGRPASGAPGRRWPSCWTPRGCRSGGSARRRPTMPIAASSTSSGPRPRRPSVVAEPVNHEAPGNPVVDATQRALCFSAGLRVEPRASDRPFSSVGRATPW